MMRPCLFLAGLLARAVGADAAGLELTTPVDWQVAQRDSSGSAWIAIAGSGPANASVESRFIVRDAGGAPADNPGWRVLGQINAEGMLLEKIRLPQGGWYRVQVRISQGAPPQTNTIEHFGVGEIFLVAGQSNAGNYGSEKQQPASGMVARFDGHRWSPAIDPQTGASGNGGSFLPAFGDALTAKIHLPVGVVPIAEGATSVREWLPAGTFVERQPTTGANVRPRATGGWESTGALYQRFTDRFAALGSHGFRAVLWHQGESDAGQSRAGYPAERQINGADYVRLMTTLIGATRRDAGWEIPWFTAVTTYHSEADAADPEFRTAQQSLWNTGVAFAGPDTDALRKEYRDGVHFNAIGLRRHGELWAECVARRLPEPGGR